MPQPTTVDAVCSRIEERVCPVQLADPARLGGPTELALRSVCFDHRTVRAPEQLAEGRLSGDLFCCLPGERADGHDFAAAARAAGAVAFLCERDLGTAAGGATQLIVEVGRVRAAMAHAACLVFDDPAEQIRTIGVTGTNGKTTTVHLLASVLRAAGYAARTIGTLSGGRTTPEAPDLQRQFEELRVIGAELKKPAAAALEVSSHALALHRVDGYRHDVAVFTNLSQDHLDFHETMEAYFEAKALLFTPGHARVGVANADDSYGERLIGEAQIPTSGYSLDEIGALELSSAGSRFVLEETGTVIELALVGRFNVENALAAIAAARALGLDDAVIAAGLAAAGPVPGRLEPVENDLGISLLVDYAHTPDGLDKACRSLLDLLGEDGRLIVVFGAGGDRDREKRPLMARNASMLAHVVVVTSDNPRHEDPAAIIEELLAGCEGSAQVHVEPDRRRAIALALRLAKGGDILLVAGKGHETTQQIGDSMIPFDDRVVAAEEAARLAGAA
jgi:UDP-N-acetylmuramoyl-L-alanyl-D-glutamate--2,6-diaminopimelate ligase